MEDAQPDPIDVLALDAAAQWKHGDNRRAVNSERYVYSRAYADALRSVLSGSREHREAIGAGYDCPHKQHPHKHRAVVVCDYDPRG